MILFGVPYTLLVNINYSNGAMNSTTIATKGTTIRIEINEDVQYLFTGENLNHSH